ncbi:Stp1/IreP family PP2C-type Ser/Thr phosphatase [Sinanaerobacter chloroacetimidivorans]|jgi:serine/threonine protein phosphatase PrpC|uniref:Stp1/IreP family PP2C-type Ser/Thr phosphatase n=1 Tax=Sinanaerobacter chloroacetimidivorans TaxID=2818044 RepID=A0A8J8B3C9_9FIRM|nr:Stp1/IreP family PP2C-type Ser/Thr phosphatase [Sinanaerobacter chloroacetimidivorans]MBR0600219.1 Stp1/IreP family PP2C-type Ser/Thr phosphatase [Sinanaerobacter chloroacetimidivorans]
MAQIGFKTDRGRRRDNNEDSLFVMPEQNIYIVADGVGGHNSGELASMTAVKNIAEYIVEHPVEKSNDAESIREYFQLCLKAVNQTIYQMAKNSKENAGMATTVVLLYLCDDQAYCMNVGDSRAYLVRDGRLRQITEDHTYVNELLKEGSITRAQAENHPQKNMITRALGGEEKILPDFYVIHSEKNDIFILCSDGLYGEVASEEICRLASKADSMSALSADLVNLANSNGGNDNITVVCLKI